MHELKGMQRASAEQQDRVAARLERSQDEIVSLIQNQKMAASAPASSPPPAPCAPTVPASPRFSAQSPQVRRRTPALQPSPAYAARPFRSSPTNAAAQRFGNDSLPVGTPQHRPTPLDARDAGRSIRAPSEASLHRGERPSFPALSYAPSCTPSSYVRCTAVKQDLFDDDEPMTPVNPAPIPQAPPAAAVAPVPPETAPPTLPDRIVVPLGAARPSVILGATSLSHSGSKRQCAPLAYQSRRYSRGQPARQEVLYALGDIDYMDED
jgi:hypothetical protein